jgi:feruloyl esterase
MSSLALVIGGGAPVAAVTTCANLVGFPLSGGTITSATDITAPFTTPASSGSATITVSAPFPFCKVTAELTPTTDSNIAMELWMPDAAHWNGKFLGVGNGALTGAIWHTSMVRPLQAGYAVANSNLGHFATNANWANGHPEKLNDYAYRGDHETATASKEIVNAFYGNGPAHSYFHGCSNGGHQALMEAQRYPDDYEAIIAGAPWNQWTHQTIEFMSRALALEHLDPAKRTMITAAVVAQCGGRDGGLASDGYLNEPQRCRFDPKALLCSGANGPNCLTADEAAAVQKVYDGPSNPRTGQHLYPGFERGSEFGWSGFGSFVNNLYQNVAFVDPAFDFHNFDFDSDVAYLDSTLSGLINSNSPDLSAFKARGGKLLMWHGWTDTTLEPRNSVNYYNSVVAVTGAGLHLPGLLDEAGENGALHAHRRQYLEETQEFFRLFMAPGVNHCGGGAGPNSSFAYTLGNAVGPLDADHDILAALDRWAIDGVAPERLFASHFTGGTADKTRPVCVYPQIARYSGHGDPNAPESWSCQNNWDRFNTDYTEALHNIVTDVKSRTLDNLPN